MCTGVEATYVYLAIAAAGTAATAYGAYEQGQAEGDRADAQARALEEQARQEREAAGEEAKRIEGQRRKVQGAARAAAAASGADVARGAPVTINQDIYGRAESDIEQTLKTGERRAGLSSLEAAGYSDSAGGYRTAGSLAAGGKLLSGSSSLLSQSRDYEMARRKSGWGIGQTTSSSGTTTVYGR